MVDNVGQSCPVDNIPAPDNPERSPVGGRDPPASHSGRTWAPWPGPHTVPPTPSGWRTPTRWRRFSTLCPRGCSPGRGPGRPWPGPVWPGRAEMSRSGRSRLGWQQLPPLLSGTESNSLHQQPVKWNPRNRNGKFDNSNHKAHKDNVKCSVLFF